MSRNASSEAVPFGRFRLLGRLGEGGMAVVHRAISDDVSRTLVVKRIRPELSKDAKFSAMLLAEAQLSALLTHPGIVQVTEFGDVDGEFYLAMEEVDGFDLADVLTRCQELGRRVPVGLACFLTRQVALALDYAHALRDRQGNPLDIVHRDVSPSNIMISRTGTVKLLDFGIAKAATQLRDERTRTGMLKGKLTYMSPEQAEGDPIDRRADIFALGVVFWECLTMQRLFRGEHDLETLKLVRKAKIDPPSRTVHEIPPQLDALVLKMLARAAADRYASCAEVAAALAPFVNQHGADEAALRRFVTELGPITRDVDIVAEGSITRTVPSKVSLRPRSGRRWIGAIVAGTIAATAVGFFVTRLSETPPPAPKTASAPSALAAAPAPAPAPPPAPAAPRAAAKEERLPPVELRVRGTRGAQVQVDGVVIGEIPVVARLRSVPGGKRTITVRKTGHVAKELVVAADRAMQLTFNLARRSAASAKAERSPELFDPFKK
jgi:serine/threonine protein kinase